MAFDPFVCDGATLKIKQPRTSGTFVLIEGVQDPQFSGSSKPEIEYTAISDTVAKKKTGRMSYGNFSFGLIWDPSDTVHAALLAAASTAGVEDDFELTLPNTGAAVVTFKAAIQAFDISLKQQDMGRVQVNTVLNGAVTVTP